MIDFSIMFGFRRVYGSTTEAFLRRTQHCVIHVEKQSPDLVRSFFSSNGIKDLWLAGSCDVFLNWQCF